MNNKINKSDQEWKDALSDESYEVTRKAGTERPFTGKYWDHFDDGTYKCIVVVSLFLSLKQNMMLAVAGLAFMRLRIRVRLMSFPTIHYLENEQKFDAVNAMPT